jgi:hypothetical protein
MGDALNALETTYFTLQTNLNPTLAACPDQDTKDQVMAQYVAARQNYWSCINHAFHDDDPALQALVVQVDAANTSLTTIADHLGDITTVIDDITKVVTIGEQIAAKVISL